MDPQEHLKVDHIFSHDSVLCDDGSSFIVEELQLFIRELRVVTIAADSPFMVSQQTCETLLCSKRRGTVLAVSGNACAQQEWEAALCNVQQVEQSAVVTLKESSV